MQDTVGSLRGNKIRDSSQVTLEQNDQSERVVGQSQRGGQGQISGALEAMRRHLGFMLSITGLHEGY